MNKIKERISGLSINKKIIYYSYLVIVPILLVICIFFMMRNYKEVKLARQEANMSNIQSLSDSISLVMTDVNNFSTYIAINQEVNQILTSNQPERLNQDTRLWQNEDVMQMVEDMMALKGYIRTVALYPENGVIPYLRCTDFSSYVPDMSLVCETKEYQDALHKKGKITWMSVTKGGSDIYLASRTDKVVLYREIYDLTKKKPLGYLVLGITSEHIQDLCSSAVQGKEETILIFNSEGQELVRQGTRRRQIEKELETSGYLQQNWKEREPYLTVANHEVYTYQASKTSPIICKVVPEVSKMDYFQEIIYMPLGLLLGVLLGLLPVLVFVSNIVSRPLQNVCVAMGKFRQGDFEQHLEVETKDEVGEVASCFNMMVVDIKELIEQNYVMELKEKESELAALQAQINPHFLYNALDALYWQACDAENEEIAENIYALSQLFRLVLGQGKGIVTIEEETELVGRYLEIQKMRFSRRMDYEIKLQPELREWLIPKLILQPFVENAVVHGIGNSRENCKITVSAERKEDWIEFIIEDTGVGMTKEQVEAIWKKRQQETRGSGYRIGRYAIYNVRERLELRYHGNFTLDIESEEGRGTRVLIRIPVGEAGENEEA